PWVRWPRGRSAAGAGAPGSGRATASWASTAMVVVHPAPGVGAARSPRSRTPGFGCTVGSMAYRYSRWDGSQSFDPLDADDVLEALSDDLMSYGDLSAALQRLHRWGSDRMPGLEQLMKQLRERREEE